MIHTHSLSDAAPPPFESQLHITRDWLFRSFVHHYQFSYALRPGQLSMLIDESLHALFPSTILNQKFSGIPCNVLIQDQKGRDPSNYISTPKPGTAPQSDEFIYLKGYIPKRSRKSTEILDEHFELRVHSSFHEFSRNGHIVQRVDLKSSGSFPSFVPLGSIGRVVPLRPQIFRLGVDLFTRQAWLGWFSGTPTVTQTLLIEATEDTVQLRITAEKLRSNQEIPLLESQRQAAFNQALVRSIGIDWLSDLKVRLPSLVS